MTEHDALLRENTKNERSTSQMVVVRPLAALFLFIPTLRAPTMTIYICASGFIVLNKSSSEAIFI